MAFETRSSTCLRRPSAPAMRRKLVIAAAGASAVDEVRRRWMSHHPPRLRNESATTPSSQNPSIHNRKLSGARLDSETAFDAGRCVSSTGAMVSENLYSRRVSAAGDEAAAGPGETGLERISHENVAAAPASMNRSAHRAAR
jgi:hypothetical protein